MGNYYTILTTVGQAAVADSVANGTDINLTQMALGDGSAEPSESQTSLQNEVYRGSVAAVYIHADNPNWVCVEMAIPPEQGPFTIREVGVFDAGGDLFAVGKYPETVKPALTEGSSKDVYIRMILAISSDANITLTSDPAALATRQYVDGLAGRIVARTSATLTGSNAATSATAWTATGLEVTHASVDAANPRRVMATGRVQAKELSGMGCREHYALQYYDGADWITLAEVRVGFAHSGGVTAPFSVQSPIHLEVWHTASDASPQYRLAHMCQVDSDEESTVYTGAVLTVEEVSA